MDPADLDIYHYARQTPTYKVRALYMIGILSWLGVLWGYLQMYSANRLFFFVVAPIVGFLVCYHLLSYTISLYYRQFDSKNHKRRVKRFEPNMLTRDGSTPLIDIFLPICGEPTDVLRHTFAAVSKLDYPHLAVYVLDDKGVEDHRALAAEYHFTYLSREHKGHMKKAGNLKFGFDHSKGDFFAIFDADFAPHPRFLTELLPYMRNKKVGIVQSPQYFQVDDEVHARSPLEYGAAHVQEDFYRYIQVARSNLGAPTCCGSNALYRRAALDSIGGTVQIEHSEDAYTGFALLTKGWKVVYVPLILAVGLCPADLHTYFHQQHRWASGSFSLMFDRSFWRSKLTVAQKLCFISGFMYYFGHPVAILFSFQIFALLFFFHATMHLSSVLPFIPSILFAFVLVPNFRLTRGRFGGFLARHTSLYSYAHAAAVSLLGRSLSWQPAGARRSSISRAYHQKLAIVAGFFFVYASLVVFSLAAGTLDLRNMNEYSLLFWILYDLLTSAFVLYHSFMVIDRATCAQMRQGSPHTHLLWRLRTAGTYCALLLVTCISLVHVYGR